MKRLIRFFIGLIPIRRLRHSARRKLGYNFRGKNNTVIYKGKEYASCIRGLDIEIDGDGHQVIIDDTTTFHGSKILLSGNKLYPVLRKKLPTKVCGYSPSNRRQSKSRNWRWSDNEWGRYILGGKKLPHHNWKRLHVFVGNRNLGRRWASNI